MFSVCERIRVSEVAAEAPPLALGALGVVLLAISSVIVSVVLMFTGLYVLAVAGTIGASR